MNHPCPICGIEMKHEVDLIEGFQCECLDECPTGHFVDEFLYGSSRVIVGDKEWTWHYTQSTPHQEIKAEVERLKNERLVSDRDVYTEQR